jgi:preprotein translocase subunit SecA
MSAIDHPDCICATNALKHAALTREIQAQHLTERPVLIGTASVEETEVLARVLVEVAVPVVS